MSDGYMHDLVALFHQAGKEQLQDMELNLIGHVIEYDPKTHMCRVLLPTRRAEEEDEDEPSPMETGWIQVGSGMVGNGFGSQYALKGGATADEPEKGEQVQVSIQHRLSGLSAVANLTYNDEMKPPGAGEEEEESEGGGEEGGGSEGESSSEDEGANATDDVEQTKQLKPGERIDRHESGTSVKFFENGDIGIRSVRDAVIHLDVKGDCKFFIKEGNLQVFIEKGNIEAELEEGDITALLYEGDVDVEIIEGDANLTIEQGSANTTIEAGDISNYVEAGVIDNIVAAGEAMTYVEVGDALIYVEEGDADIDAGGAVNIAAGGLVNVVAGGAVDIAAPIINIIGGVIQAGTAGFQKLMNAFFGSETYNTHTHPNGGPPVPQAVPGLDTTFDFEAS